MATFIDGFAGASLGMISLQLLFSLAGVPFDGRVLPLRTNKLSRADAADCGSVWILLLHPVPDAVRIDLLHLGGVLPGAVPAVVGGSGESVPAEW